jgi:haloalkane dehalogenase
MSLVYREALPELEPLGTLLLVHGHPASSYMWRHLMESSAAAGWQSVAPDLPGYGDSPYGGPATWKHHLAALDAFHRDQELGEVVLVAHDWGGLIGLRWACEHPESVRALVISASAFLPDAQWHPMGEALRTPGHGEALLDGLDRVAFGSMLRSLSPGMDERAVDEYFKASRTAERRRGQLELYRSGDLEQLADQDLGALDIPALLVWGADDALVPVATAHRLAAALPQAELVVVEHAGHFVFDDAPAACSDALLRFLDRL